MSYFVENGCTVCLDTPENWAHFNRLKYALDHPRPVHTPATELNQRLNAKISGENKRLRELRRALPGHEPDRL